MQTLATHYEVLGVAADADTDEIRRAYTAASMRWHPDRHTHSTPYQRAVAGQRILEINEAWRVLASPSARADYDRSLSRPEPEPEASSPVPAAGPPVGGDSPPPRRPAPTRSRGRWGWVLVAVGVLLAAVLVVASLSPGADEVEVTTREGFAEGACVRIVDRDHIAEVPCESDHDATVIGTVPVPRPCPRNTISFVRFDQRNEAGEPVQLCLQPLQG